MFRKMPVSFAFVSLLVLAACGSAGDEDPQKPPKTAANTQHQSRGDGGTSEDPEMDRGKDQGKDAQSQPAGEVAADAPHAQQLIVRQASDEPGAPFYKPDVEVMESMPIQFALNLTRDLPMAGGRLVTDDVKIDTKAGRIVARITEYAPDGPSAAVITPTSVRLAFGNLRQGRYRLDLLLRQGEDARYELLQSLTLVAK